MNQQATTEKFMLSVADRNAAIYRLADEGRAPAEIAAALGVKQQIVQNFLGTSAGLWD